MHYCPRLPIFWASYPLSFLTTGCRLEDGHASSFHRMAHGPQHGLRSVGHLVGDGMGDAVGRNSLPVCSLRAAGARLVRTPAMAQALVLYKDANGLRALDLKPASLLRTAQPSLPVPRSHRAPAGRGQKQNPGGGDLRTGLRTLGLTPSPKTPACAPAPDWRPIPSLRSVIPRPPVVRAAGLTKHRIPRVWGRSLCCRSLGLAPASAVTGSVSAGALPSPCSAWGLRITALPPLGACANFRLWEAKSFCHCLQSISNLHSRLFRQRTTIFEVKGWLRGARPINPQKYRATFDQSHSQHHSIENQTINKE